MPRVSVCLPVFNGAQHLAKAIESALAQTYEDFELLIADDCSLDQSPEIIEMYAQRDQRIIAWKNEKNLGLFPNYNVCLEKASGKYIKPFAQDDLFRPSLIERLVSVLDDDPSVSLVASARCLIGVDGRPIKLESELERKWAKPFTVDTKLSATDAIGLTLRDGINWLGEPSAQMYRAELADGGFDTAFQQIGDLEYSFRLLQSGDYYFIADELCDFRKHASSSTAMNDVQLGAHLEWLLLAAKYRDYLPRAGMTPEQYCLNFIKSWTRDLECDLNRTKRLGVEERVNVLHELFGYPDLLSQIRCNKNAARDTAAEYKILAALALLQSSLLEQELRTIHQEIARPYIGTEPDANPMVEVRSGLATALGGLKETLRERDKEIVALRSRLDELGNSVSWKVTEPLRKLRGQWRKPDLESIAIDSSSPSD
jgi:hypothetical protein